MTDRLHRVAALDLGTNSFHLVVAEITPDGAMRTVAREKIMLRLGDEVGATGRIGADAEQRALDAVATLTEIARTQGAVSILAAATAAIREAENGAAVVAALEDVAGCPVEVISGELEARLIFRAVQESVDFDGATVLGVDIGGGSVELTVGDQQTLGWATSLPLGVGRLTARFVHGDPIAKAERFALDRHIRSALASASSDVADMSPTLAVGTSGTLLTFARIVAAARGDDPSSFDGYRVTAGEIAGVARRLLRADVAERGRVPGLDERRVDLMPAASVLVLAILDEMHVTDVAFSTWGLREGLLLRESAHPALARTDPSRTRRRSVLALGRRHNFDESHGRQTTRLALALHDALGEELGVGTQWREVLEGAALVHDVGNVIALKGHDRHGAYILRHGELAGFEPDDRALLEALVRYHRSGSPRRTNADVARLPEAHRVALRPLLALLRIADGLDRSRSGNVQGLDVSSSRSEIVIRLRSSSGDPALDLWGGRRKAGLLAKVAGKRVRILGPDDPFAP